MKFNLEKLLIDVFDPQLKESVLIIQDLPADKLKLNKEWEERLKMAKEWHRAFLKLAKKRKLKIYPLLFYQATGKNNAPLPKFGKINGKKVVIEDILRRINICLAFTEYSATAPLVDFAKKFKNLRAASLPGVSKTMEKTALLADYKKIQKKVSLLAEKLTKAIGAEIKFSNGERFYFDLRNRKAGQDDGYCHQDKCLKGIPVINLPSGEAFIAPQNKTQGFLPILENKEIIVLKVNKNKIVEVIGKGKKAEEKRKFFSEDKGRTNIAELGLGCNEKAKISGHVLEDEKTGFHFAYGLSQHLGGTVGVKNFQNPKNAIHQDIVYPLKNKIKVASLVLIYKNGKTEQIMKDSKYTIF